MTTVLRYVERNPLRANLIGRAEDWPWSSLSLTKTDDHPALHVGPVPRGRGCLARVNKPQTDAELTALRQSVNRGTPRWQEGAAQRLGLESSLRPRDRPRKTEE